MFEKLQNLYPNSFETVTAQSSQILDTLHARPIYTLLTSLFLDTNFEIAPLVAPISSWLLLNLLIFQHVRKRHGISYAVFLVFAFSSSFYMRLDFIGTTTDSICALFCYLSFHYLFKTKLSLRDWLLVNMFVLLAILSRPVDPIFLVLLVGMIFGNYKNRKLLLNLLIPFVLVLFHLFYIQLVYSQLETGTINTGGSINGSFINYVIDSLLRTPKLIFIEFGFVLVNDFLLFLLVSWSWIVLFAMKQRRETSLYFLIFLSTFFLAALNGTLGSGFRYELPVVMVSLIVIANGDSPQRIWENLSKHLLHAK
jgi:hypothetical protein